MSLERHQWRKSFAEATVELSLSTAVVWTQALPEHVAAVAGEGWSRGCRDYMVNLLLHLETGVS